MINATLIESFLAQGLSAHVRAVLNEALRQRSRSDEVVARLCEFNCFDVAFDFLRDLVVIQDVLDSGPESSVEMPLSDFIFLCGLEKY
ncbi:hypothetical protein [Pseudomonas corrugata]|uniref:hypothetical protein n=1 Tax=Pseudomonas corrugata TaxID=47879 RepID=UPI0008793412|nr:hypothetical protein [Pseudomonas corrugata]MDU9042719.1 hypothetical protein [Pseudomonas corrugata]SDV01154.1 hypothetical protein SAMN04490183_3073 [Pseudomonas corrugata]